METNSYFAFASRIPILALKPKPRKIVGPRTKERHVEEVGTTSGPGWSSGVKHPQLITKTE